MPLRALRTTARRKASNKPPSEDTVPPEGVRPTPFGHRLAAGNRAKSLLLHAKPVLLFTMKHDRGWGFRGACVAAAWGIFACAGTAQAQGAPGGAAPDLRQQIAQLAANPTSVTELIETGRAALAVGDAQGALGFFTRASELAPRDARVRAGLASAHARTGRPETALVLFAEAEAGGAPDADLAADRGLAHDLLGNTARAQQDYVLALRHRDDPEVRRRLALSLAISGQREAALRVIDGQIRGGDRAGQRAHVMVLALSGDVNGATAAARASLPAQASQAIVPFLPRLAALAPGDKASAANLGRVPTGARLASATGTATADPAALAFAGGGRSTAATTALAARLPIAPVRDDATRRRPGGVTQAASTAAALPSTTLQASARLPLTRSTAQAAPDLSAIPHPGQPVTDIAASAPTARLALDTRPIGASGTGGPAREEAPNVSLASLQPTASTSQPGAEPVEVVDGSSANLAAWNSNPAPAAAAPAPAPSTTPAAVPVRMRRAQTPAVTVARPARTSSARTTPPARTGPAFSDVVATVGALPAERTTERPTATTRRRNARATSAAATRTPAATTRETTRETARAAPANTRAAPASSRTARGNRATSNAATAAPTATTSRRQARTARHWVQLGTSPNLAGFGYQVGRLRETATELRAQGAFTAPSGTSSHRLLFGPFPTEAAAQTFLNTLARKNVRGMIWTSPAGTDVAPIPAR